MSTPTENDVHDQLTRILASEEFTAAKRLSAFLKYITLKTLNDPSASLQAYPIALEVFGRPSSFDPQHDTIVRVQAGQLRLRLEKYYAHSGRSDPVVIKVPKGGYVPTFSEHKASEPAHTPAQVDKIDPTPSIVVLPFSDLSSDPDRKYFGLGLTEDIISALSCFSDIQLFTHSLTSQSLDADTDFIAAAKKLNVRFLLDGSIRHGPDGIRISARVIEVKNSKLRWANSYTRKLVAGDIFGVKNEIAEKVAAEIAGPSGDISRHDLLQARQRPPETMSAYDAVLRAYGYRLNPNSKDHAEISTLLKAATKSDPNYADAVMMLSFMHLDQGRLLFNIDTTIEEAFDRALDLIKQAIDLAPESAFAWHILSLTYFQKQEFSLFEHAAERSLSLNPNQPDTLVEFGFSLWTLGQRERGLEMVAKALSLTPFPPGIYYMSYVQDEYLRGRDEHALRYAQKLEADDLFWKYFLLAAIYGQLGRANDAKRALNKVYELNPAFGQLSIGTLEAWPFPSAFNARMIEGLEKAGYVFSNALEGV